jgi:DNA-binding Xre family transcriptional regulator
MTTQQPQGKPLREWMVKKGFLINKTLAEASGVSEKAIWCIGHNKASMLATLEKVCAALGIQVEELACTVSSYGLNEEEYEQLRQRFSQVPWVKVALRKTPSLFAETAYPSSRGGVRMRSQRYRADV